MLVRKLQPYTFLRHTLVLTALLSVVSTSFGVTVSNTEELEGAVAAANTGGDKTILLTDGTYTLNDTLYINAAGITLAGKSGDPNQVIIQGDGMSAHARVGNLVRVAAENFTFRNATLQRSRWHLIQIVGEANADRPIIENCRLRDAYEQMLKVTVNGSGETSNDGLVANCVFEYSEGIGPQYYIGGIDAHGAKNWIVRSNVFRNIISPNDSPAEFAVHFWNGSENNLVEKNIIINCDRGIGFGMEGRPPNTGGVIKNNVIYHAANKGRFADTGIALTGSPNTKVYNNTILLEHRFPWAIEYRFPSTRNVTIVNNLTNKPIISRDGGFATVHSNFVNARNSWFEDAPKGDLHLASAVPAVGDSGIEVPGLVDDIDGDARPEQYGIDIGADEFVSYAQ